MNYPSSPPPQIPAQRPSNSGAKATLIGAVACAGLTLAMWIVAGVLAELSTHESGLAIVLLMTSIFPAGLSAVLFLIAIILFAVAAANRVNSSGTR